MSYGRICGDQPHTEVAELPNAMCEEPRHRTAGIGLQGAFVEFDGLQCGYCTPGQICSAIGMLSEYADGAPSGVSEDVATPPALSRNEIRERMSGNLCRCGAYNGIVDAIESVSS